MELVRVLPSSEDEVNVACFHPRVGGGLVYGTKVVMAFLHSAASNQSSLFISPSPCGSLLFVSVYYCSG